MDLDLVFERGDMEDPNGGNSEPVQTDDWIEMPTVEETRFFQDEDLGLTMTLTDLYRDGDSGYIVLEMELENSSDRDLYLQPTRVTLNGLMCGGDMDTVVYAGETYTGVIVLYNQPEDMGIYKLTEAEMWYYVVDYDTDEYLTEELYALFATSDFGAEDAQMDYTMGVEIYNDNDILVYMIEELVDEDGDVLLSLYIENTGETDVIIYGNSFSAQGWELSDYFSPIVYAGSKQIYPMYIYQEEYQNYGLLCPFIAELDVEFWDENWDEIYPATIFQIPVDLELDIPQQVLPPEEVLSDGQTIYDENGLTIIVYEQYEDEDGDMDLLFYVKNDSDKNVEIMDNGFYLGENVLEDYFWLDLEAHSETTYIMYVYGDEIALAGGSTPFDVDLVLTFTDMDTAEELYPAETLTFSVTAEWTGAGYYEPQPTGAEVNEELLASGETIYNEHGITIVLYDQFVDEDGDVNLLFYLVNNSSYDISVESQVFRVGEYDLYDWLYTTVDAYQDDYFTLYIYGVEMEDAEVSFPFDVDLVLSFSDADEWESLYPDEALSFTVQPE